MKWPLWGFVLVIVVLAVSGCTQSNLQYEKDGSSESGIRASNAMYIGNFFATQKGNDIEFMFSLWDSYRQYTTSDGTAHIRIVNSNGMTVYQGTFNTMIEDFNWYTWTLTGEELLACKLNVPMAAINKSFSSAGTAYIEFRTASDKFEELDAAVYDLPTYTEEEAGAFYEEAYDEDKTTVNQMKSDYGLEVTVLSAGRFTHRPYGTWSGETTNFRIDLKVKNLMSEKQSFSPSYGGVIVADGKQYEAELFVSDIDGYIFPGVTVEGYLLFDDISVSDFKFIIEDEPSFGDKFEFDIDLTAEAEAPDSQDDTDSPSGSCGGEGEQCCPNDYCHSSYETSLTCVDGECVKCGGTNQPPCSGFECDYGEVFHNGVCVTCGSKGEPCCSGDIECDFGYTCEDSKCVECGGSNQIPCDNNECDFGYELIDGECIEECDYGEIRVSGSCVECGDANQPCCGDNYCYSYPTTTCIDGTCEYCGREGEICCDGDECNSGYRCVSGTCESCGGIGEQCCSPDNIYICLIGDCIDGVCVYSY